MAIRHYVRAAGLAACLLLKQMPHLESVVSITLQDEAITLQDESMNAQVLRTIEGGQHLRAPVLDGSLGGSIDILSRVLRQTHAAC